MAFVLISQLGANTCIAQTDSWERVKLIETGKSVSVTLVGGKTVKGKMHAWSPDSVTILRGKDKTTPIAKSDVAKVAMVAGMSRGRRALWAAGIGGAVGAGIFGAACSGAGDCDVSPAVVAAGSALWIGGISAGIAALIPQHKEVIYTAGIASPAQRASASGGSRRQ
jgi:hypothetical protein